MIDGNVFLHCLLRPSGRVYDLDPGGLGIRARFVINGRMFEGDLMKDGAEWGAKHHISQNGAGAHVPAQCGRLQQDYSSKDRESEQGHKAKKRSTHASASTSKDSSGSAAVGSALSSDGSAHPVSWNYEGGEHFNSLAMRHAGGFVPMEVGNGWMGALGQGWGACGGSGEGLMTWGQAQGSLSSGLLGSNVLGNVGTWMMPGVLLFYV